MLGRTSTGRRVYFVLSLVVVSYLTPKPSDEKLKPFFE